MLIQLQNVSRVFPIDKKQSCRALDDVSLTIDKGEMVAIVGKSGAGKSTLLHILGAIDKPTEGTYHLDGHDVGTCGDGRLAELRNRYVGFVLQEFALINDMTAQENILLPVYFGNQSMKQAKNRAREWMEAVGIYPLRRKKVRHLSGGERQRVAIARALINDPQIILADEPTGNLDSQTAEGIFSIFQRLNSQGKTVVMVTHDTDLAARCGRIVRLGDGKVIEEESLESPSEI